MSLYKFDYEFHAKTCFLFAALECARSKSFFSSSVKNPYLVLSVHLEVKKEGFFSS